MQSPPTVSPLPSRPTETGPYTQSHASEANHVVSANFERIESSGPRSSVAHKRRDVIDTMPSFKSSDIPNLTGRVAIVTGGNSGLGE
uniref:Uncharacterized protein n=1 Tax=Melanopsichium pennsylvanicum 4 TaxID=1398559 RepID=A0A077R1L0_9BASI|nr:uncharacterized protein BN887_04195 [Melanopsichium pennsylvanicum 4]